MTDPQRPMTMNRQVWLSSTYPSLSFFTHGKTITRNETPSKLQSFRLPNGCAYQHGCKVLVFFLTTAFPTCLFANPPALLGEQISVAYASSSASRGGRVPWTTRATVQPIEKRRTKRHLRRQAYMVYRTEHQSEDRSCSAAVCVELKIIHHVRLNEGRGFRRGIRIPGANSFLWIFRLVWQTMGGADWGRQGR